MLIRHTTYSAECSISKSDVPHSQPRWDSLSLVCTPGSSHRKHAAPSGQQPLLTWVNVLHFLSAARRSRLQSSLGEGAKINQTEMRWIFRSPFWIIERGRDGNHSRTLSVRVQRLSSYAPGARFIFRSSRALNRSSSLALMKCSCYWWW